MGCNHSRQLQAYLDAELPLPQRAQLESHLRHCGQCRSELAERERLERLLAELAPATPPAALVSQTMRRARRELRQPRPLQPSRAYAWLASLTAVAAAAACLLIVLQVGLVTPAHNLPSPAIAVSRAELAHGSAATLVAHPVALPASAPTVAMTSADRPRREIHTTLAMWERPAPKTLLKARAISAMPTAADHPTEAVALAAYREAAGHAGGDPDMTVAALENVALAYPQSRQAAKALLAAGGLAQRSGNLAEADVVYRRVLTLPAQSSLSQALAHKALADLRRESVGDDEVALYHYQQAARALRSETSAHDRRSGTQALVVLADIEKKMGQPQRAAADYATVANSGSISGATAAGSTGEQATMALAEVL